ncbi:Cof-type HAD-IIB family hydrolase, partial [Bacillus cereus]|nr:Cof-type HAD-IIB family hydrolase [Bacillus cereus]
YLHQTGLADIVCANEQLYTKRKNEHHHNFVAYMGVHIAEIEALEEEFGKTVNPAKLFVFVEEEKIVTLDQEIRDTFQGAAEV